MSPAVTGPFLEHYVHKGGLTLCCKNRSRPSSRASCLFVVYLSSSTEFAINMQFAGTSLNSEDKLLGSVTAARL